MAVLLVADDEPRVRTFPSCSLSAQAHCLRGLRRSRRFGPTRRPRCGSCPAGPGDARLCGFEGLRVFSAPVIVFTASTEMAFRIQALDQGPLELVVKPLYSRAVCADLAAPAPALCAYANCSLLIAGLGG